MLLNQASHSKSLLFIILIIIYHACFYFNAFQKVKPIFDVVIVLYYNTTIYTT